ncbi:MAG: Dabb family protein [Bauldia sp.]
MAIVDPSDLFRHAAANGYSVPVVGAPGLAAAVTALGAAEEAECPLVLSVFETGMAPLALETAMPAIEATAERAGVPVVLRLDGVADRQGLGRATRLGFNLVGFAPGADPSLAELAARGGVMAADDAVPRAPEAGAVALESSPAGGRARAALAAVRRWRAVEHVVMFNAEGLAEAEIERLFRIGCEALGAVPGVRDVRVARAITPGARYGLCWFVRFANETVAATYKDDPGHVEFADTHFRPVAADRLTIDFVIL